MDSIKLHDGSTSQTICNHCVLKRNKTCHHPTSIDGNTQHCAIRWPQYVTSLNWPSRCLQTARMWTETTQKHTDHQSGVQSLASYWVWAAGMHGCCPAVAGDQVAVDLWNAPGKDVAATSQMGCPATAVVPRVSGSRKPPIGSHKRIADAKPPASVPLTSPLR